MEKISLVIFDMDGLMFDTENVYIASWVKVGRDLGYDITPEFISKTMGLNVKDANILFKKHFGDAFPYYEAREKKIEYATQHKKIMEFL